MKDTISVVPYDPIWSGMFDAEACLIKEALGNNCSAIHHIGSTSVPGLRAKPIIDILPVVHDIVEVDRVVQAMQRLGYDARGEYGIAFRRYFQKSKNVRTHNVHVYEEGDPEIDRYLKFRDWLRTHPDDAQAYAALKVALAAQFPEDILQYCTGKEAFVAAIDAKSGYDGWRMVQALTDREWNAVRTLRKDAMGSIIQNNGHVHFVLYKNADIIGYAHLHFTSDNPETIRLIAIVESYQQRGFEVQLRDLCERWLAHRRKAAAIEPPFSPE